VHNVFIAPHFTGFIDQVSSLVQAPRTLWRNMHGDILQVLHENPVTAQTLGVAAPKIVELPAEDGTLLYGAVYHPQTSPPQTPAPLVLSVYGGPAAQIVLNSWRLTIDVQAHYLSQHGCYVFKLDNRGSAGRGVAFEQAISHRMATVELQDQITGIHWLAQKEPIDRERIGIYGWSYGGYMTLMALSQFPDIFHVGVAGAPVADFRWYDSAYTERYMGRPLENLEGYSHASVLTHLPHLHGALLIIHGLIDENVHFRHSARVIDQLIKQGTPPTVAVLPSSRHMPRGEEMLSYITQRRSDFLLDSLRAL
ncbi:MAG: S9 family peptidase, partial [Firmicutes bacterium]|nr:S9 family peptidase [Bacillota bacterium]